MNDNTNIRDIAAERRLLLEKNELAAARRRTREQRMDRIEDAIRITILRITYVVFFAMLLSIMTALSVWAVWAVWEMLTTWSA